MKTKEKIIKVGAEAVITKSEFLGLKCIKENRIKKKYRDKLLDAKIRKKRIKKEIKLLKKARNAGVRTPIIYFITENTIIMEFIKGQVLKTTQKKEYFNKLGKAIALLHKNNIIHGDLTTSNIIITKTGICMIDFGLGFESTKIEDKAIDLLNLKKTLKSSGKKEKFKEVIKTYKKIQPEYPKIAQQIKKIEKRVRYR